MRWSPTRSSSFVTSLHSLVEAEDWYSAKVRSSSTKASSPSSFVPSSFVVFRDLRRGRTWAASSSELEPVPFACDDCCSTCRNASLRSLSAFFCHLFQAPVRSPPREDPWISASTSVPSSSDADNPGWAVIARSCKAGTRSAFRGFEALRSSSTHPSRSEVASTKRFASIPDHPLSSATFSTVFKNTAIFVFRGILIEKGRASSAPPP